MADAYTYSTFRLSSSHGTILRSYNAAAYMYVKSVMRCGIICSLTNGCSAFKYRADTNQDWCFTGSEEHLCQRKARTHWQVWQIQVRCRSQLNAHDGLKPSPLQQYTPQYTSQISSFSYCSVQFSVLGLIPWLLFS